ncbi:hypothetical protein PR202_ga20792 [Eleusine coracana subsp. coracana]|uniref:Protein kinase domain-containing protein n=1 Tax=Eleusine coracana subsp. coracana TaxID=191504 RepID=A0AAV5CYV3_ELECO|nr:hypothetical protein QOZ80_8AG0628260 [Eleusine coracana subsp. coracana]GJN03356.1 hypothetical protein PR202_ga20792 [Eleusine coracana subsp. coracana]
MRDAAAAALHHAVVAVAAAALVTLAVTLFLLWRKKKKKRRVATASNADRAMKAPAPLPVVPLADVERATDGFHRTRLIGRGPHFAVYAAGPGVAAKRMHPHLVLGAAGGRHFPSAVRSLAVPPHPDLAALVGVSEGPGERVLLVDRAPAGSRGLDTLLFGAASALTWRHRAEVAAAAAAAARALAHLHAHGVAHGRVRPCNVLVVVVINGSAQTRLTDYGLAGFLDAADGNANIEEDVYMFGAVLLELLTGRLWDGGALADWALPRIRAGSEVLDAAADKAEARLLARAARVALACVGNADGRSRPRMNEVADILSDVEAAFRRREGEVGEDDGGGDEERLSGCLLAPSRSVHKADLLLRPPPV